MVSGDEEKKQHWVKTERGKAVVTWGAIIAIIGALPALIAVNSAYDGYHITQNDKRYYTKVQIEEQFAKKSEVIAMSEADTIKKSIAQIETSQKQNSKNIDFLVKSEAAKTVIAIRQELIIHRSMDDGSQIWRRELGEIESRLKRAEDYKSCIVNGGTNCDAERIW